MGDGRGEWGGNARLRPPPTTPHCRKAPPHSLWQSSAGQVIGAGYGRGQAWNVQSARMLNTNHCRSQGRERAIVGGYGNQAWGLLRAQVRGRARARFMYARRMGR